MENQINEKVQKFFSDEENLVNLLANASYSSPFFSFGVKKGTYDAYLNEDENNDKDLCREDKWAKVLLRGGSIMLYDVEEEEEHVLDLHMIYVGATKLMEEHEKVMANIFEEEDDFYDNDAVIQYAIFGEWVYG